MLNAVELEVTAHGWSALRSSKAKRCQDRYVGAIDFMDSMWPGRGGKAWILL
ncbi:hypothetical protein ABIE52_006948 [Rhodococcus sp. OAS809]